MTKYNDESNINYKNYLHKELCTPCGKMTYKENHNQNQNDFKGTHNLHCKIIACKTFLSAAPSLLCLYEGGGGGGAVGSGVKLLQNFQKEEGLTGPQFLERFAEKEGVTFFSWDACNF